MPAGVYLRTSQHPSMVPFVLTAFLSSVLVLAAKNPKRGLAFADSNNARDLVHANQSNSAITWQYDWLASPSSTLASSGIQYVPMQWGIFGIQNLANSVKGAKVLLAFNEPDLAIQSNLHPRNAALLWKQYIQPLKSSGIKLVSPAVTSAFSGIPWLQEFISACGGCTVDAIAVHWYGSGSKWFIEYLNVVHAIFPSHPIWVTEFADTSTDANAVLDFLKQSTAFMDSQSWVERYAWFAYMREDGSNHYSLLDSSGNLNALGRLYVTP
ncbi:hypothetical protein BDN71DRAFT_262270 [Pleurotus eryngii]|uniref:Asl1-like glycosyl hydrolase catalytic domain-containing protein n=1 Tax=Pleurotus eryngii TaxID=5323 RepID=A0A9P6A310_PLEER|nr:hypothetical protein BDN71DRAFT_262270 [Pleurotus eryngii]